MPPARSPSCAAAMIPATLGANPEGRKVRGVIHWVSASHGVRARSACTTDCSTIQLRMQISRLPLSWSISIPNLCGFWTTRYWSPVWPLPFPAAAINSSVRVLLCGHGFSGRGSVFNRTVTLRDSWARIDQKNSRHHKSVKLTCASCLRAIAQLGERNTGSVEVSGSIPLGSTRMVKGKAG